MEIASLDFVTYHGGDDTAGDLLDLLADSVPSDDCCALCEIKALSGIADRHPDKREGYIDFIVREILEDGTSYSSRVYLILALEALTGESFKKSGFPMAGWCEDKWAPVMKLIRDARRNGVSPDSAEFRQRIRKGISYLRRREMLLSISGGAAPLPEEEKPNIERGLKYIREWHEKRRASQGRQK